MNIDELTIRVEETHKKYLEEKRKWKLEKEELLNEINKLKEEANKININEFIDKEKGWNIREKQLIDSFERFKKNTYGTVKYLVEEVIEKKKEEPTKSANITVRTNGGPAESKKLIIRPAERELQEMIDSN